MYVVADKATGQIVHVNSAPVKQGLADKEVYLRFDPETMEIGVTDCSLPEHFRINDDGEIVELTIQEKIDAGIIVLDPSQIARQGEVVEKTLSEKLAEGLVVLDPTQKIVTDDQGERIVEKTLTEQLEEGVIALSSTQKVVSNGVAERIIDKTLAEQVAEGLITLEAHQKIVGDNIEEKTTRELIDEGLLTREDAKKRSIERLRVEILMYFDEHTTPNGYRIDDLARQKASFSAQFRSLPDSDENKRRLLDDRLIYPDAIVDEILDEIGKIQGAYSAAKSAIVAACDQGEPAETWESISVSDFLATEE